MRKPSTQRVRKLLLQWQTWDVNLTFGFQPGALPPTVPPGAQGKTPWSQGFWLNPRLAPAVQPAPGQGKRELWGTRHHPGLLLSLFLPLWLAGALPGAAEQKLLETKWQFYQNQAAAAGATWSPCSMATSRR